MSKKPSVLVIQGPNLNLLGSREPQVYGHTTLSDIHQGLETQAKDAGILLSTYQSNHEGELIDCIQVHLSNIHQREEFRKHSYLSDIAKGVICGLGPIGYALALQAASQQLK
jgi:3-dehydroquinate dehydratase-2